MAIPLLMDFAEISESRSANAACNCKIMHFYNLHSFFFPNFTNANVTKFEVIKDCVTKQIRNQKRFYPKLMARFWILGAGKSKQVNVGTQYRNQCSSGEIFGKKGKERRVSLPVRQWRLTANLILLQQFEDLG